MNTPNFQASEIIFAAKYFLIICQIIHLYYIVDSISSIVEVKIISVTLHEVTVNCIVSC